MKKQIPSPVTHQFNGPWIAKSIFLLIALLTICRSLLHMFLPDSGAESIATIPLHSFTSNGAATVILIMSLWGLSQLLMGLVYVMVLWKHQEFIPSMYALIFIEYTMRIILMHIKPIHIMGTAPGHVIDYFVAPLALVMFFFSLEVNKKSL